MNICIPHARLVPTEVRCRHQTPWNWSCRWLLATMWMLETDLRPFVRESSALNHGGIPLALKTHLTEYPVQQTCMKLIVY